MARSDKKNRTCERCGKECANPNKLREHLNRKFKCKPIPIQTPALKVKDQRGPPAPVVHVQGKDRRKEKPEPIPISIPQDKNQENDPEAGPGPSTQAYREGKPNEVERQDTHDRHARKPREHLKIWGARLRRRWVEVTGEECDLPITLKACQSLHHDLLQADNEAFEEIIPQGGEPSDVEQQDAQEQTSYPTPKPPANVNIKQFKTIFIHPSGRKFITNKEAEKWDKEHPKTKHPTTDPEEARFPTLAEIEAEIEKNRLEVIENLPLAERQEYEVQREYASGNHFRSIYPDGNKEIIVEPPNDEIKFLERKHDSTRSHPSLRHLTTWEAIIPSIKNPAYAFNKRQDNEKEYAYAPYMHQLIA